MKLPRVWFTVRRMMVAVAALAVALGAGRWYRLRQVARDRLDSATDYARMSREADELAERLIDGTFIIKRTDREAAKVLRAAAIEFRDRSRRFRWAASQPELPLSEFRPREQ